MASSASPAIADPTGATRQVGWVAIHSDPEQPTPKRRQKSISALSPRSGFLMTRYPRQHVSVEEAKPNTRAVSSLGPKVNWNFLDGSQESITTGTSSIQRLPAGKFVNLEEFFATGCGDSKIPEGLLGCKRLSVLSIKGGHFNECDLPTNPLLESLMLCANEITKITNTQFFCLHLQTLNLANNYLKELPTCIGELGRLTTLILAHNNFSEFPEIVTSLPSLTQLDVSSNQIPSIPDSICHLTQLERLNISRNPIAPLPNSFAQLTQLTHLYAVAAIKQLDPIQRLPNLLELDISRNGWEELLLNICELSTLIMLNVSHNALTELPDTLSCLQNLQRLNASHNKLTKQPSIKVRVLCIANNPISEVNPDGIDFLVGSPPSIEGSPLSCSSVRGDAPSPPFLDLDDDAGSAGSDVE